MIKQYLIFPLSIFFYFNSIFLTSAFTGPETFSDLAESVSPSVVNISTTGVIEQTGPEVPSIEDFFNFPFNMPRSEPSEREFSSLGSGFVISEDGFIVTNNHVVENASDIQVTFTDGTKIEAELIAADAETDLALLKVDSNNLNYLEFGDSDTAKVGNWVMAIGNPHGLGGTVTAGIVSARGRMLGGRYDDFIQTDASINRGNSGGPLFKLEGKVIGVNSMIISPSGLKMFEKTKVPILGIVENMSYFIAPDTGKEYSLYGESKTKDIAEKYDYEILANLPHDPLLMEQSDKGHPLTDLVPDHKVSKIFNDLAETLIKKLKLEKLSSTS